MDLIDFRRQRPCRQREAPPSPTARKRACAELCGNARKKERGAGSSGLSRPEAKFTSTTEYDTEGRVVKVITFSQDGSKWICANTYDEQERLVKTTSGQETGPVDEITYQYDEKGRMVGYSQPSSRNQVTRFEYSENGRKTRVATSTLQPSSDGPYGKDSMFLSLEFGEDIYYPTPLGGAVKTLYDENDRPARCSPLTLRRNSSTHQALRKSYNGSFPSFSDLNGNLAKLLTLMIPKAGSPRSTTTSDQQE
jgi:hypothetical protein